MFGRAVATLGFCMLAACVVTLSVWRVNDPVMLASQTMPQKLVKEANEARPASDPLTLALRASAQKMSAACSSKSMEACANRYTEDVTVYDMLRGRAQLQTAMEKEARDLPYHWSQTTVEDAGAVGGSQGLAWANGYWFKKHDKGYSHGRYSAVFRQEDGEWKPSVVSTIEKDSDKDWTPVKNGKGGQLKVDAANMVKKFTKGVEAGNFQLAFSSYSHDAQFPFMGELGGTSLSFAAGELNRQKQAMEKVHLSGNVDEVLYPVKAGGPDVAVAHGFSRMHDPSGLYLVGRTTYLMLLEREQQTGEWKVCVDFCPNRWLDGPKSN